jgi:hypothetical protein
MARFQFGPDGVIMKLQSSALLVSELTKMVYNAQYHIYFQLSFHARYIIDITYHENKNHFYF